MLRLFTPMTTIALISSATIISTGIIGSSIKGFIKRRKNNKIEFIDEDEETYNHYDNYYDSYTSSNSYNSYSSYNSYDSYSNDTSSASNRTKEISEFSYWDIVRAVEEELRSKSPCQVEDILNQNGFYNTNMSDYEAAQEIADKAQYGNILNPSYFASSIKSKLNNMY